MWCVAPQRRRTGLVWTTSFSVKFIHVSQLTRWPLRVSPFFSSTSMGCPWAALRRPRGSCEDSYVSNRAFEHILARDG